MVTHKGMRWQQSQFLLNCLECKLRALACFAINLREIMNCPCLFA
ncbi:hypothetical protein COLO4_07646 [Corchorus olitorius]|uniref:Uncharacterized protein n=1 Tax=Corchorus olitorius TaxID=93759 RepID=A0A1R3KJ54_9ROSI|nr:hypothetical protein COLO4_07646 [Corchorus olitorius]